MSKEQKTYKKSKLLFSGTVTIPGEDNRNVKVGTIRLFEVNSDNEKAPALSGEIRIRDRYYRTAVWRAEGEE